MTSRTRSNSGGILTDPAALAAQYREVRRTTERLCEPLATEDYVIQAMADVSPAKWHLPHVSWSFETFLLKPHLAGYEPLDPPARVPLQLVLQQCRPPVLPSPSRPSVAAHGGPDL